MHLRSAPVKRDWTALPEGILFTVFLKLGPREIFCGADPACTAWRHVAVGEPTLWRRLDMGTMALSRCLAAVRRAAGQCESLAASCDSDASLLFLVRGAPSLKSLRLFDANVSFVALNESIRKLSQLEELEVELSCSGPLKYKELILRICEARPQLKRLSVTVSSETLIDDEEELVIPIMCNLRSLELTDYDNISMDEWVAIIDKCPLLESLRIRDLSRYNHWLLRSRCEGKNLWISRSCPHRE
ncbi:hypothetical protein HU200_056138 [Digitaria exilis]|uniref:F-box domain-containing protein n=1 Tax=Digitaria exilis TaxID=1010633 RepID=A0A835ARZ6_9POAL|nr:hypothetical protein HU200_056138 [Digitaria exilis]